MKRSIAFSLIELMIVITIIGILAAVAVPSYSRYVIKSKVIGAYPFLEDFRNKLIEHYQINGSFPATFEYAGVTYTDGVTWGLVDVPPVKRMKYRRHTAGGVDSVVVWATLSGLSGIVSPAPVYAEPDTAEAPRSVLRVIAVNSGDAFVKYCGMHTAADTNDVPLEYLPANCSCTNIHAIASSGAAPVC